jgi:S-adenosylmethionine/arginine decarboxylase-like enzyme
MVVKEKARVKDNGKDHMQDLVKSIVDTLWSYDSVKRVVNNNYIILQAIVRNTVKSLGINTDNFDYESFMDNFDVHELDTKSQDTLVDSLAKVLSKFIVYNNHDVDIAMEKAPYEIESRLREVLDYLKSNPNDSETIDYAKELIQQLHGFNWLLASKYERELENIVNPKPKVETEPKPVVRVIEPKPEPKVDDNDVLKPVTESRLRQIKSYERLRPKLRELRETTTRALEELRKQREAEIYSIEVVLFEVFRTLKDPRESKYWNENIELARSEIERLRRLDPEKADRYERELEEILSEIEKNREPKARVHVNRGKIIAYIPMPEKPRVNDVNAVDVDKILRPRSPKPRSVKTNTKTEKSERQKPGLLRQLRQIMDIIGRDFVNMYYYRSRR